MEDVNRHYSFGKPAEREPYHYVQCGLDNVFLYDGYELECIDEEEYVRVRNVEELWKGIGISVATEARELQPKEIRFLRNHMELTQDDLAKKLGVEPQTLARWEKSQTKLPGPADLAIRTLFLTSPAAQPEGSEIIGRLFKVIEDRENNIPRDFSAINFIRCMEGWKRKNDDNQLELTGV
ncbi:helix-turn-helix domain-containing protein [Henriciella marina]|uniref:helix-turn-helix domain-containing protein n=1 Tax=Henriciella marina TaxID=453851 RepID=UPI000361EFC9|nr:helix-turn-helix domain-containing protein [Henriciella marina]